jgi:hypothetical protein
VLIAYVAYWGLLLIKSSETSCGIAGGKGGSPYDLVVYGGVKLANSSVQPEVAEIGIGASGGVVALANTMAPV